MAGEEDYSRQETELALGLLMELLEHLKAYREHVILAGGWAPYFLIRDSAARFGQEHIGSLDADLILDFRSIPEAAYETIMQIVERAGYSPRKDREGKVIAASFERIVPLESGGQFPMRIDFLAGEYGGTTHSHRHQRVQGLLAHKARGADIAYEQCYEQEVSVQLPNQAKVTLRLKVANEVAVFVMKGIAIGQRTKGKDFYDVYMLVKFFKQGPRSIEESLKPFVGNRLLREAVANIRHYFWAFDSLGPVSVAEFVQPSDAEARAVVQRDAFEIFQVLLDELER
jgi:hypothetical protein